MITRLLTASALLFVCAVPAVHAQDRPDTAASLKALEVKKHIRVHKDDDGIRFTLDDDADDKSGEKLQKGQVFVTNRTLKVTVQNYNPLQTAVSVKVKAVENATTASLTKLLEAIVAVGGAIKPATDGQGGAASIAAMARTADASCQARIQAALGSTGTLNRTLFGNRVSAENINTKFGEWRDAITKAYDGGKSGQTAIRDGAALIQMYATDLKADLDSAKKTIKLIDEESAKTPTDDCGTFVVAVYEFIRLTNPHARLREVEGLHKNVTDLHKKLVAMSAAGNWVGRDFVVAKDIVVTPELDADVTIEMADLSVEAGDASLAMKQGDPVSTSATIQFDTGWVLEPSVGLTVGYVTRPKYGTDTVDGRTIVARTNDDRVSVNPTVMLNLISRHGTALLRPMVQFGASTSKDAPALFMGAGWRLFGSKNAGLAFGGGLMLAWVKDLKDLKENDPVGGTKDIEADLAFDWSRPKPRLYWSLQYKF